MRAVVAWWVVSCAVVDAVDVTRRGALGGVGAALASPGSGAAAALVARPPAPALAAPAPARSTLAFPEMGIGAWAWGDSLFWGYDPREDAALDDVFKFVAKRDDGFVDTAELYGLGRSESLVGEFSRKHGRVTVATKFAALPWRTKRGAVVAACEASLKRLGAESVDLYQIHFPGAWANEAYWDGLADCVDKGLVKHVGVSNYGSDAVRAVVAALGARGVPLASNQIQYSLAYPFANANGLKKTCDDLGVKVLAYSPLGLGLLSGKYSLDKLPAGPRKSLAEAFFSQDASKDLLAAVAQVQSKHGVSSPTQVAINWCRGHGACPIPGCRTPAQVAQNYASLDWKCDKADMAALDAAASRLKPLVASAGFPEKDAFTGLRMFDS